MWHVCLSSHLNPVGANQSLHTCVLLVCFILDSRGFCVPTGGWNRMIDCQGFSWSCSLSQKAIVEQKSATSRYWKNKINIRCRPVPVSLFLQVAEVRRADRRQRSQYPSGRLQQSSWARLTFAYRIFVEPIASAVAGRRWADDKPTALYRWGHNVDDWPTKTVYTSLLINSMRDRRKSLLSVCISPFPEERLWFVVVVFAPKPNREQMGI